MSRIRQGRMAGLALAAVAIPAQAATITSGQAPDGHWQVVYTAAPGEINQPTVAVTGECLYELDGCLVNVALVDLTDPGATISGTIDTNCLASDQEARCLAQNAGPEVVANLGDGNDVVSNGYGQVHGQAGDDTITGGQAYGEDGNDRITALVAYGGPGDDVLTSTSTAGSTAAVLNGGDGADVVTGGAGEDHVDVRDGAGADTVTCGDGTDFVQADIGDEVAADCENVQRS